MTRKSVRRGKQRPDFGRVPAEVVDKGTQMLRQGVSAAHVMRELHVSYPTVLKWKKAPPAVAAKTKVQAAPKIKVIRAAEVVNNGKPTRRTEVGAQELLDKLIEVLTSECQVTLTRDRDSFIAQLQDARDGATLAHNSTAALAMMDVLGKWKRESANGH